MLLPHNFVYQKTDDKSVQGILDVELGALLAEICAVKGDNIVSFFYAILLRSLFDPCSLFRQLYWTPVILVRVPETRSLSVTLWSERSSFRKTIGSCPVSTTERCQNEVPYHRRDLAVRVWRPMCFLRRAGKIRLPERPVVAEFSVGSYCSSYKLPAQTSSHTRKPLSASLIYLCRL
jgi:hypothetical protein